MHVVATTREAAENWLSDATLKGFQKTIQANPRINAAEIIKQLADHPDGPGQWGDEAEPGAVKTAGKPDADASLKHGFAVHLRIPYAKSTLTGVWLNGAIVTPNSWIARGYHYVEVPITPDHLRAGDLFVVSCRYEPGERTLCWDRESLINLHSSSP